MKIKDLKPADYNPRKISDKKLGMIFIACPFWDEDKSVRKYRRKKSTEYADILIRHGLQCYSPLVYTGSYNESQPKERYWLAHGLKMLDACSSVRVLCLPGWEQSKGVKGEIAKAQSIGLEIKYVTQHEKLSFHGSRSLKCATTTDLILSEIEKHNPSMIVTHGEPKGVCAIARRVSMSQGVTLKLHHLNKTKYAQGMYHHRSMAVLLDSDFAVFVHDGKSSGTANEYALAKKLGIMSKYYVMDNGVFTSQPPNDQPTCNIEDVDMVSMLDFDLEGF